MRKRFSSDPEFSALINQALEDIAGFGFGELKGADIRAAFKEPNRLERLACRCLLLEYQLSMPKSPRLNKLIQNVNDAVVLRTQISRLTVDISDASYAYGFIADDWDEMDVDEVREQLLLQADNLVFLARRIATDALMTVGLDKGGKEPPIERHRRPSVESFAEPLLNDWLSAELGASKQSQTAFEQLLFSLHDAVAAKAGVPRDETKISENQIKRLRASLSGRWTVPAKKSEVLTVQHNETREDWMLFLTHARKRHYDLTDRPAGRLALQYQPPHRVALVQVRS